MNKKVSCISEHYVYFISKAWEKILGLLGDRQGKELKLT